MSRALFLTLTLLAGSALAAPPIIRVQADPFPTQHIYLQAPDTSWRAAEARIAFADPPPSELASMVQALTDARAQPDAPTDLPTTPALPDPVVDARLVGFAEQTAPGEGVLLVLLVDASKSMTDARVARVVAAAKALTRTLREQDRVAVISFSESTTLELAPEADGARAVKAIEELALDGKQTFIFGAVNEALSADIPKMKKDMGRAFPDLPNRRFLFVFSDGLDDGSRAKVEDVLDKLDKLEKRGLGLNLFTVGVGEPRGSVKDPHRDLQRLADVAAIGPYKVERFYDKPMPVELAKAYVGLRDQLADQLRIDFELPTAYWQQSRIPIELRLTVGDKELPPIPLEIEPGALTIENKAKAESWKASVADLRAWHARWLEQQAQGDKLLLYGSIGAGALLLLLLAVVLIRTVVRKNADRQHEALAGVNEDLRRKLDQVDHRVGQSEQKLHGELQQMEQAARAHSRVAFASLLAIDGPMKGARFAITKRRCIAGREADCDMVFPQQADLGISRKHVQFQMAGDGTWQVLCLSPGGMGVNGVGVRHTESYPVRQGDHLQMGSSVFLFDGPA